MSKVNENIAKFRKFRKMTQADLARQLGKSKNSVSNWESNGNTPDFDTIEKICKILKVSPNEMFGWTENPEYRDYENRVLKTKQRIEEINAMKARLEKELRELEAEV